MDWREKNQRIDEWSGRHPIRFAIALALLLAVVQLLTILLFGRPFTWFLFFLWTIVFPITMALIVRSGYRSRRDRSS